MMTQSELEKILNRQGNPESPVLSLYLEIDPAWEEGFHRKFEVTFKSLLQSLEKEIKPEKIEDLRQDASRAWNFISNYKPGCRGLVLFSDDSEDFFLVHELKIQVPPQAYWLERPYILPLLEALDEYERCGVILVDKERARIFTYTLGEIEEEKVALAWNDVRRFKTTGKDNLRSAFKLQRTTELHEQWHLKHVVQMMEEKLERKHFDRLILGGSKEAVDELIALLPPNLHTKIAGRLLINVQVHEKKLLEALMRSELEIEREEELKLIEKFIQADGPNRHRVLGPEGVLAHLNRGEIHTLVYSENFKAAGSKCRGCGYLFSNGRMMCGRCGSPIDSLPPLLEEMARRVVQTGGSIEKVRENAARRLDEAGGIGALLKRCP